MMQSTRAVYAVILVVALVLAGLMLVLINTTRLTDDAFSATVDARVAMVLTDQGIMPTAVAVQTQAAQNFEATSQANIALALTSEGIMPKLTEAAQNFQATLDSIRATQADQPASVLTQIAELYPSETPSLTPSPSESPTATDTATATGTPAIASDDPATVIQALINQGYFSEKQSLDMGAVLERKLLSVEDDSIHWYLIDDTYFTDFVMSTTFALGSGNVNDTCGLIFRYQDSDNFYIIDISGSRKVYFRELRHDRWLTPQSFNAVSMNARGETNQLVVVAVRTDFVIFLNGQQIGQIHNTQLQDEGSAGVTVGSYGPSPATGCDFQNTWVWRLNQSARPTLTPSNTPTATNTPTITPTPSNTATPSATLTPSNTPTPTVTLTPTATDSPSLAAGSPEGVIPALIDAGVISAQQSLSLGDRRSGVIRPENTLSDNQREWEVLKGNYRDFVLGTMFNWGPGADDDACGLIFHLSPGGANYYSVMVNRKGDVLFENTSGVTTKLLAGGQSPSIHTGRNDLNQMVLVAVGHEFTLFINGERYQTFTDETLNTGVTGVVASTGANSSVSYCTFTKAWVWTLNASKRPTATPTVTPTPRDPDAATSTPAPTATRPAERPSLTGNSPESVIQALINDNAMTEQQRGNLGQRQSDMRLNRNNTNYFLFWNMLTGTYTDFVLSTTFTWGSTAGLDGCGVLFRAESGTFPDYYAVTMDRQNTVLFTRVYQGQWDIVDLDFSSDINTGTSQTNRLLIVGKGNQFRVYINGHFFKTFLNSSLRSGRVAVAGDDVSCNFSDTWVWRIEAPAATPTPTAPAPTPDPNATPVSAAPADVVQLLIDQGYIAEKQSILLGNQHAGFKPDNTGKDNSVAWEYLSGTYQDFVLNGTFTWGPGAPDDGCGLLFRSSDQRNYYLITLTRQNVIHFSLMKDGSLRERSAQTSPLIGTRPDDVNQFTLLVVGNQFKVFINNQLAKTFTDDTLAKKGEVGVAATTGQFSQESYCNFSDAWVWWLNESVPPPPAPLPTTTLTPPATATKVTPAAAEPPSLVSRSPESVVQALIDEGVIDEQQSVGLSEHHTSSIRPDNSGKDYWHNWESLDDSYGDFVIGVTFEWGPGSRNDSCGLVFRNVLDDDRNYYMLSVNREHRVSFSGVEDDDYDPIAIGSSPDIQIERYDTNRLLLVAVGQQFTLYINGVLYGTYTDVRFDQGTAGVLAATGGYSDASYCTFTDTWAWELDETSRPPVTPTPQTIVEPPVVDLPAPVGAQVFGPQDAVLYHNSANNLIEEFRPPVKLRDFVAQMRVHNPYAAESSDWDFGIFFRDDGSADYYELIITSHSQWTLYDEAHHVAGDGYITNLDTSAQGSNLVTFGVYADKGVLYINGDKVATLDLSRWNNTGAVAIITGAFIGDEVNGKTTNIEDFTLWSFDAVTTPTPTPVAVQPAPGLIEGNTPADVVQALIDGQYLTDEQSILLGNQRADLKVDNTGKDNNTSWEYLSGQYQDFVMGTTFKWGPGATDDGCGLLFRSTDQRNYYLITLDRTSRVQFTMIRNGQQGARLANTAPQIRFGPNAENTVVLVVVGGEFSVFINGELYTTFHNALLTEKGEFAVAATTGNDSDESYCTFSDAWVWWLDENAEHPSATEIPGQFATPDVTAAATSIFIRPATATRTPTPR